MAIIHKIKKDFRQAFLFCSKAIEAKPDYGKAYSKRGCIYYECCLYTDSLNDFREAKRISPGYSDIDSMITNLEQLTRKENSLDYYAILEVDRKATIFDIKKSFKKLSLKWHPDKNRDLEIRDFAEKMFKLMNEAHSTLSSPEKKKEYDYQFDLKLYGPKANYGTNFTFEDPSLKKDSWMDDMKFQSFIKDQSKYQSFMKNIFQPGSSMPTSFSNPCWSQKF